MKCVCSACDLNGNSPRDLKVACPRLLVRLGFFSNIYKPVCFLLCEMPVFSYGTGCLLLLILRSPCIVCMLPLVIQMCCTYASSARDFSFHSVISFKGLSFLILMQLALSRFAFVVCSYLSCVRSHFSYALHFIFILFYFWSSITSDLFLSKV